jgi:hypothetical protein
LLGSGIDSDNEEDMASPESVVRKGKKKKSKKVATTTTGGAQRKFNNFMNER